MLTKVPFYHETTKKLVVAFGGLFGGIFIRTKDTDDVTQKIVKCPIAFANKEKFIVRLQQDPGLNEDVQILVPRLSFEITGIDYDPSRQLNKIHKTLDNTIDRTIYYFNPVPYNISFSLYSYTRTIEDNLQIMEQILPFFSPEMNVSIKMMQDPDIIQDIPLILNSVNLDDAYDGGFEDRRYIISSYSFTMKCFFYGPILQSFDPENHFENSGISSIIKRVEVNINGRSKYTAVVNPFEANSTDVYTIDEGWEDIQPPLGQPSL